MPELKKRSNAASRPCAVRPKEIQQRLRDDIDKWAKLIDRVGNCEVVAAPSAVTHSDLYRALMSVTASEGSNRSMTNTGKTGLVVTAHPGDFVWRAGGGIALHARKGYRIKIVCLSFGERGESHFAWKEAGATLEKVKAGRRDEAQRAAEMLGAEIEFFDAGDYPLRPTEAHFDRMVDIYRELNPSPAPNIPTRRRRCFCSSRTSRRCAISGLS